MSDEMINICLGCGKDFPAHDEKQDLCLRCDPDFRIRQDKEDEPWPPEPNDEDSLS